ncbi:DUF397 domain-containing protein [Streptomyces sp. NPDC056656]|uniref:DUF397 domain-containing protein n=1 Tax=Streptomyces sp. NPDC056656 TaxID=3345895 RepID=UPI0036A2FE35
MPSTRRAPPPGAPRHPVTPSPRHPVTPKARLPESCLCLAPTPTTIHIRDSKNPDGPRLTATLTTWAAFITYAAQR